MNRVSVQVENFGEWRVGQIDETTIENIDNFEDIKNAKALSYIDRPTTSAQLSQGVWRTYKFAAAEIAVLQDSLKRKEALFRMQGPSSLPLNRASQMMQWDIGYGKFSGGLSFRPKLDISYTLDEVKVEIQSSSEFTAYNNKIVEDELVVGFDKNGEVEYGCLEFNLSQLPQMDNTVISTAYLELEANEINAYNNIRFHVELVVPCKGEKNYENIQKREIVERVGYDVSIADIKMDSKQRLVFDRHTINEIVKKTQNSENITFVISASSKKKFSTVQDVKWMDSKRLNRPAIVINYIKKRRNAPKKVTNLTYKIENGVIRLDWENPDDGFKGVIVVKDPFKIPCTPYDGQKLYGGSDNYTYDNFGDKDVHKHYAVFSYDDVPNFSEAAILEINTEV